MLQVTFPENSEVSLNSSLNVTVSGTTDNDTSSIYVNGSSGSVILTYGGWSYNFTIVSYTTDLHIASKDSLGNITSEIDYSLTVQAPTISNTTFNESFVTIPGETSTLSSLIEVSLDSITYSTSGIVYVPHASSFSYNYNFIEASPTIYFRAQDSLSSYSAISPYTLNYKLNPPVIFSLNPSVTSISVNLSGIADYEAVSLVVTPNEPSVSGFFVSDKVTGFSNYTSWGYSFTILKPLETFTIKSIDIFGNDSDVSSLDLNYSLEAPVITYPTNMTVSSYNQTVSGYCNSNSNAVLYSSTQSLNKSKIISTLSEPFLIITSINDVLNLNIGIENRSIVFPAGSSSAADIVSIINSYFSETVASESSGRIVLTGNNIKVLNSSSGGTFGFFEGNYNLSYSLNLASTTFNNRNTLNLNIDDVDYIINFSKEIIYSEEDIISTINSQIGRTIAFSGINIITAESNIHILKPFTELGISDPFYFGYNDKSDIDWSFNFNFYSTGPTWYFCALDQLYNFTDTAEITFSYSLIQPVITSPGVQKPITDSTYFSSSGSSSIFETASGNFIVDGIITGDKILVLSGSNIGSIGGVTEIYDTYLVTDSFSSDFSNGDKITIYSSSDRPTFTTNLISQKYDGLCDVGSNQLLYFSDSGIQSGYVKLYSEVSSINFDTTNNLLKLQVDSDSEIITFKEGQTDSQTIIDQINGYFLKQTAYLEDTFIYLQGNYINIDDCSSLSVLNFPSGSYNQCLEISVPDTYKFESGDADFINIMVDNKNVQYKHINSNADLATVFTKSGLINTINSLYNDKKIAFASPNKMIILGNTNISIKNEVSIISLSLYESGIGQYTKGSYLWAQEMILKQTTTPFNIFSLDYLYNLSASNSLTIIFKVEPPVLTNSQIQYDSTTGISYLETTFNYIDLSGTYNKDGGYSVSLNGTDVYNTNGSWAYTLENLTSGTNEITAYTLDIFGNNSDALKFNVIFNDPNSLIVPEDTSKNLNWVKLTQVTPLGNSTINSMLEVIEDTFSTIVSTLKAVTKLLNIVKSFISKHLGLDALSLLKKALQKMINDIIAYIEQLSNGDGLYVLSTLPTRNFASAETWAPLEGGFSNFISKVNSSFDDQLDPHRPIIAATEKVGAMVFAASDTGGVSDLLNSFSRLTSLFSKDNPDFGLVPPENLKAIGENRRVVLTWSMPKTAISPTGFYIYRAFSPGGNPVTQNVKGADFGSQAAGKTVTWDYDITTGELSSEYDLVGILGSVPATTDKNWSAVSSQATSDWWNHVFTVAKTQIVKDFMFVDGVLTGYEKTVKAENEQTSSEIIAGKVDWAVGILDAIKDFSLTASGETGEELVNGVIYYYKVVPAYIGANCTGSTYEVAATPTQPDLIYIEEDLSSQITRGVDPNGMSLRYILSSAIYDDAKAVYASDPSAIIVHVDGQQVQPDTIDYKKGIITLLSKNQPEQTINVEYWGKQVLEATRAFIISANQGDFVIKKGNNGDNETNKLVIQVGQGSNLPNLISSNLSGINLYQNVVLVRDFGKTSDGSDSDTITLSAEEVASRIRSQTSGINVRTNSKSQIIIEDNRNPDMYNGSYLKIHNQNSSLGFGSNYGTISYESTAGISSGNPPDWYSIRPADLFPIFNDLTRYIQDLANKLLNSFENATKSLTDFIDLLIAKVQALSDLANEIKNLLEQITKQMYLTAGLYFLNIPYKKGGVDYIKSALTTATGTPTQSNYTAGVVILYSAGATMKAVDLLFGSLK